MIFRIITNGVVFKVERPLGIFSRRWVEYNTTFDTLEEAEQFIDRKAEPWVLVKETTPRGLNKIICTPTETR